MASLIKFHNGGMRVQLPPARKIEIGIKNLILFAPDNQDRCLHLWEKVLGHTPVQITL